MAEVENNLNLELWPGSYAAIRVWIRKLGTMHYRKEVSRELLGCSKPSGSEEDPMLTA